MSKYISEDILLEDLWDSKCESDILRRVRQAIVDEIIGIEGLVEKTPGFAPGKGSIRVLSQGTK